MTEINQKVISSLTSKVKTFFRSSKIAYIYYFRIGDLLSREGKGK